ncbi:hypothetical protein NCAS_0A00910 [Naumovozyma castellii]|uniref:Cation efflux protein transmembrane domain-containing protein n=1 Tax=Naumovozyma castellii TaxID=27288 RepID=G0V5B5_NAUCA|nr:hypothetical protein NCAS_0A00910 [Naumovozyma castellii CBS 4309]CCC66651.1 hypothetical protein NCAS_0A00910 [Naumovozyma castellii CBS 4309]
MLQSQIMLIARGNTLQFRSLASFHTIRSLQYRNSAKLLHSHNLNNDDFNAHDHVHLRESETEKNDSIQLGVPQSHTHSHSHSHANPLLKLNLEQVKHNPGVRITWIGLGINVAIAAGKFVGGIVFHSQALFADSIHALSDLISDVLTLFSVKLATSTPSKEYPYGHGKVETVGSLAVSTILAMAGISIGWTSLCTIVGPIIPHIIMDTFANIMGTHGHSHSVVPEGVADINAAWIAGGSIVVKEWIFHATKKIAIQTNSNVLMANAWHHRVDSLTSLVALVAITSGYFFNVQSLDAIGGLIVSGLVIKAGGEGMIGAMKELIDQSIPMTDPRYVEVETAVRKGLENLVSNNNSKKKYAIKDLTLLSSGRNVRVVMTLLVPIQRWDNVLGIHEFENVSNHVKNVLYKNVENVGKIDIEFVEEKEHTSPHYTGVDETLHTHKH